MIKFLVVVLFAAVFFIFTPSLEIEQRKQNAFNFFYMPLLRGGASISTKARDIIGSIYKIKDLSKENVFLKKENSELKEEIFSLREVKQENDFLREAIQLPQIKKKEVIMASVVARDPHGIQGFLIVDKGIKDNIKEGMAVLTNHGQLVGKVKKTKEGFSEAELLSGSGFEVRAVVENSRVQGVVKGQYGTKISMGFIPKGKELKEGDAVLTFGDENYLPKGIFIGELKNISMSQDQLFQEAEIIIPQSFVDIERVFILLEKEKR